MNSPKPTGLRLGNRFWQLVLHVLEQRAGVTSLASFLESNPGKSREAIAHDQIKQAARRAGVVGFITGGALSLAEAGIIVSALSTFASLFASSPVTVPALAVLLPVGIVAFATEIVLILRIQLHLAYDLFILYQFPIDLEKPEHVVDVVEVAFGIKGTELVGQAAQKLILPQLGEIFIRRVVPTRMLAQKIQQWGQRQIAWQFARKYLVEGILVRGLVPGLAVFTATSWDYLSTRAIGKTLQTRIARRELAANEIDKLATENVSNPEILQRAVLALALTDRQASKNALSFYTSLANRLNATHVQGAQTFWQDPAALDWDGVVADLAGVEDEPQKTVIFDALVTTVIVDGRVSRRKRARLQQVANLFEYPLHASQLKARVDFYSEPEPGRACLYVVIALFILIVYSCLICSLGTTLPFLRQYLQGTRISDLAQPIAHGILRASTS